MGSTYAMGLMEMGGCNYATIQAHFQGNMYPPVPSYMIPLALRAIKYANKGDYEHTLRVPKETTFRGKMTCKVWQAIESLRLEWFLKEQE